MPDLHEIEQFKNQILSLGNEPSIMERWGQSMPEIQPTEETEDEELSELLGGEEEGEEELPAEEEEPGAEEAEEPEELEAEETPEEEVEEVPEEEPAETEEEPAETEEEPAETEEELGGLEEEFGGEEELGEEFELPEEFSFGEEEEGAAGEEEAPGEEGAEEEPEELEGEEELSEEDFSEEGFPEEEFPEEEFPEAPGAEEETGEEEAAGGEEDLGELEFSEDELSGEDFEVDEFSLDDLGEEFGAIDESEQEEFAEEEVGEGEEAAPEGAPPVEEVAAAGEEEEELELSDDDFFALRNTLLTLPLNLKLRVEELVGEEGLSGDNLQQLTDALVKGRSPKDIAELVKRITGEKIEIPKQYEKKTGEEYEREKGTFGYLLRYNILPMVRTFLIAAAIVAGVAYLGYRFVYQPVYAYYLYNLGYDRLEERDYTQANDYFDRAVDHWVMKDQFFRYADGYREQQQWVLAEEKYEQLLSHFPFDKQGTLEYARMETEVLADYEKAEQLLNRFLEENFRDYEALLLLGDTYLEWGKEDPAKLEEARTAFATLMEEYGVKDEILFRMLSYFIRTDNMEEVLKLKNRFQADPGLEVNPEVYAELGGYLIDKDRLDSVRDILLRAKDVRETLPEIHYQLARYFKEIEEYGEERKALNNTLAYLRRSTPLSRERLFMKIDTYRRLGERQYAEEQYLQARSSYQQGIELYENARERKLIRKQEDFGRLYADLGDIHYYVAGEYDRALEYFTRAEENLYTTKALQYKKGYVNYRNDRYRRAGEEFQNASGSFSANSELMYATANTWFRLDKYHSAEGYYTHLLDLLKQELNEEQPLRLQEDEAHRELVRDLMQTSNNLGVTYYELYRKTGRSNYYSKALVQFSDSSEYFDRLTRNPETMERAGLSNLGYLNQRGVLFPGTSYEQQIYPEIPLDMQGDVILE